MGDAAKKLIEAAMLLPEAERVDVAAAIWETVSPEPDPDWDAAWETESERREQDGQPTVEFESAYQELMKSLSQR